jgi:hypothetical protein
LRQVEIVREERDLDRYFDLAGCHGDERERAGAGAPRNERRDRLVRLHKPGF